MGHSITAIILKGGFDKEKAKEFDLIPISLGYDLSLFHIDHYYSACWQFKLNMEGYLDISNVADINKVMFPKEIAIAEIMKRVSGSIEPRYAIIFTDYFGGIGDQSACFFHGAVNIDKNVHSINEALKHLGVVVRKPYDEFDTVGLGDIRSQPEYLEKYVDLANEYGV